MNAKRPWGVTIVAVFSVFWGCVVLLIRLLMPGNLELVVLGGQRFGFLPLFMIISAFLVPAVWVAFGAGLMTGRWWGWWLGGFHSISGCIRFSQTVLLSADWDLAALWSDPDAHKVATPFMYAVVAYLALLWFLYTRSVRQWCAVQAVAPVRALAITTMGVLVVMGGLTYTNFLWQRLAG